MRAPRAMLFDLDGTLLDTAPDMVGALNALLLERERPALSFTAARPYVSHGAARLVKVGFPDADAGAALALQSRYLELYRARVGHSTRLFEGMDRVLVTLAQRQVLAGIVTNKPAWLTEPLLDVLGLASAFACVVSGDTVAERKPHAMPMLHAAQLAGVDAADCVYVGDAERDVQAAHAAGMTALVATYGYLGADDDWTAWHGDAEIRSPLDLIAWLDTRDGSGARPEGRE